MNYILTYPTCFPSAKILRDFLQKELGYRIIVTKFPERVAGKLLLRYGNSQSVENSVVELDINPPDFIKLTSNKKKFSELLLKNDIKTPKFRKISAQFPESLPVMVRTTLTGSRGKGISVINDPDELMKFPTNTYWTEFLEFTSEYRVHVVNGEIVKVFRKKLREGETVEEFPVRTNDKYMFYFIDFEEQKAKGKFQLLKDTISRVDSVLSGKMYALDIGYKKSDGYTIIECNSAPGLNENTAEIYARILTLCIKESSVKND